MFMAKGTLIFNQCLMFLLVMLYKIQFRFCFCFAPNHNAVEESVHHNSENKQKILKLLILRLNVHEKLLILPYL